MSITQNPTLHLERHLTVAQIAERWGLSDDLVRDIFLEEKDVIVISSPRRGTRTYKTLRIPESVVQRVWERLALGGRLGNM